MERMRPMSEAPRSTKVWVWWKRYDTPESLRLDGEAWVDEHGDAWHVDDAQGWTPIVRPLEPDAPEPEAQTMPPTPQRLRLQIRSAAQESVALGIGVGELLEMAKLAHGEATKQAARATADEAQKGERTC